MTADIAVIIPTFGDYEVWGPRAERAAASVDRQTVEPAELIKYHGGCLADARNFGAFCATASWLIFLDADDELDERYVEAMAASTAAFDDYMLFQPMTLGVYPDGSEDDAPAFIPEGRTTQVFGAPLLMRNHLIIGTMVSRHLFDLVGGFEDLLVAEDWALWLACWVAGATWVQVPDAIYRVGVRPESRNQMTMKQQAPVIQKIRRRWTEAAQKAGLV